MVPALGRVLQQNLKHRFLKNKNKPIVSARRSDGPKALVVLRQNKCRHRLLEGCDGHGYARNHCMIGFINVNDICIKTLLKILVASQLAGCENDVNLML